MGGEELARREGTLEVAGRGAGKEQLDEGMQAEGAGPGAQR